MLFRKSAFVKIRKKERIQYNTQDALGCTTTVATVKPKQKSVTITKDKVPRWKKRVYELWTKQVDKLM